MSLTIFLLLQVWTNDVYPKLDNTGYGVVGGRVTGPAVGGFTLGGGYSWLTNQYGALIQDSFACLAPVDDRDAGLTCDTVQSYTLVLPNGTVSEVDSRQPDLFFALKGGLNRFGIVTNITMKLFPQPLQVYGGYIVYPPTSIPAVINATNKFSATNTDPKAQVITSLSYLASAAEAIVLLFYDGPTAPASLAPFLNIPALYKDVSTRSFSSFAKSSPSESSSGTRGAFHTLSTTGYTQPFLQAVYNESTFYGALAALHSGVFIDYDIEPFLKTYGQKTTNSAYPHAKSPLPLNLYFAWTSPTDDAFWRASIQQSVNTLTAVAKREGIYDASLTAYPNYALSTYTGDQLYGSANAAKLRQIKAAVDPNGVMDLTGGFKL
ncbi:MAG: hypothetical protein Q9191_007964 [Dirinaria sp. TL-2023a]